MTSPNKARLVCAMDVLPKAREVMKFINAPDDGYDVRIAAGRLSIDEIHDPDREDERLIIAWSKDGMSSPWVTRWIEAKAATGPFVEITFDGAYPEAGGVIPHLERRVHAPIDFSHWNEGDRSTPAWKDLEKRLRRAFHVATPPRQPVEAVFAMIIIAGAAFGSSVAARLVHLGDDAAPAPAAPTQVAQGPVIPLVGGPTLASAEDAPPPEVIETHVFHATPLPQISVEDDPLTASSLIPPFDPDAP